MLIFVFLLPCHNCEFARFISIVVFSWDFLECVAIYLLFYTTERDAETSRGTPTSGTARVLDRFLWGLNKVLLLSVVGLAILHSKEFSNIQLGRILGWNEITMPPYLQGALSLMLEPHVGHSISKEHPTRFLCP